MIQRQFLHPLPASAHVWRTTTWAWLAAACVWAVVPTAALADEVTQAQAVVVPVDQLYAAISAKNLPGVMRFLPPEGGTEIGLGENTPHALNASSLEKLFTALERIDVRPSAIKVQDLGGTFIVTGVRQGTVTPQGRSAQDAPAVFTMVWQHQQGQWWLRHVHLSAAPASLRGQGT